MAQTILNKHEFKKIDVPLTNVPGITWYKKDPFAVGIQEVCLLRGHMFGTEVKYCQFFFLYGKFIYGTTKNVLGMKIMKKIESFDSLETITNTLKVIESLPDDLVLCLDINFAKPLIEAYFKLKQGDIDGKSYSSKL
jgi:hypothetical protein